MTDENNKDLWRRSFDPWEIGNTKHPLPFAPEETEPRPTPEEIAPQQKPKEAEPWPVPELRQEPEEIALQPMPEKIELRQEPEEPELKPEPGGGAPQPTPPEPQPTPPEPEPWQEPEGNAPQPMPEEVELRLEPQEIVCWYIPGRRDEEPAEGVWDLPDPTRPAEKSSANVWRQAAGREKKRRRRRVGILLLCLALLIGGVGMATVLPALTQRSRGNEDTPLQPEEGDSASSIVDIFGHRKTSIPRYQGDPSVRLTVRTERGEELSAMEVYAKVNPAVVTVVTEEAIGASIGTGVIMTPDGYIITNAHVISGGQSCWVALDTGVTYDVKLVGYDEDEDLAVLKAIDAENLPVAEFGDSESLQVGEKVYAIGNPLGVELRGTLTDGIISAVNRQIEVGGGSMTVLQTTAALNNGNSGGPLINSSGQVIGINTLKMSGSGLANEATVEGLGFALPISSVCFVVNDLIASGQFRGVPTIGITVITNRGEDGKSRVEVYSVAEDLGAAEAGVQEGDVILAADGQPVMQTSDLLTVRRTHAIGDTMVLTLLRDGRTFDVEVTLYSSKGK